MAVNIEIPAKVKRTFVGENFKITDWESLKPYFDELLNTELDTEKQVEEWILKSSELDFVISEDRAWRYIRMTCNTQDEDIRKSFDYFITDIMPHLSLLSNQLLQKIYHSEGFKKLDPVKYEIVKRNVITRIRIFREENIPIQTEIRKKGSEYDKMMSELSIEENGEKITLQKAASLLENENRSYRENIWKKVAGARLEKKDEINALFSELVTKRTLVANNAGFNSYADYKFADLGRFDYTREDCAAFHSSIEKIIKPLFLKIYEERRKNLGLAKLRHWDLSVDELGRKPLKPFHNTEELLQGAIRIFSRVSPELGQKLRIMREMGHLDLGSRIGKAPGGYNYPLAESGVPFIFMNAVGTQGDLTTMIHEGGHAIHSFAMRDIRTSDFKYLPAEVAELASMSMELLSLDYWDEFYNDPDELHRAQKEQITRTITLLPWIASIDAFQFWIYDHPVHTVEEREEAWKNIFLRFHGEHVDWTGNEDVLRNLWQRQGHIFDVPFYYIEYGIAQLGAIAVWRRYTRDHQDGLQKYLDALAMGYTRPIPEIYQAAGIRFDFSEGYIHELIDFVKQKLEEY